MRGARLLALSLVMATNLAGRPSLAWWPSDPAVNVPVCTAPSQQYTPAAVTDGAGGVIVAWYDYRTPASGADIYVQRISHQGVPLWTANGIAIGVAAGEQAQPAIASDGADGAIVVWRDGRNGDPDLYAQRVGPDGAPLWAANGIPVCAAAGAQSDPVIVSDRRGGAIVAWVDTRGTSGMDLYVQRIGPSGEQRWASAGVPLVVRPHDQSWPRIVEDGAGGAIVAWQDSSGVDWDIRAQRVDSSGTVRWAADGAALCSAVGHQRWPHLAADGMGGAIADWSDYRLGPYPDVYAQRVDLLGNASWTAGGVAVATGALAEMSQDVVADGAGGAFVVVQRNNASSGWDLLAYRLGPAGTHVWSASGVTICGYLGSQWYSRAIADGLGGLLIAWTDGRRDAGDIYAQRLDPSGSLSFSPASGVVVSQAADDQHEPVLVDDGEAGAILVWGDARNSSVNEDLYCQDIDRWGFLGAQPVISAVLDRPGDEGGVVSVTWTCSPLDVAPGGQVASYRVWREVPQAAALAAIARGARVWDVDEVAEPTSLGQVRVVVSAGARQYWESVGALAAEQHVSYWMMLATTGDSAPGSNPLTAFMVEAIGVDPARRWWSDPKSGFSVDDIAPPAPTPFTGEYFAGTSTLHWAPSVASDIGAYRLYRGTVPGFVPAPANLVVEQADTGYVDVAGRIYYYRLTAVDFHGNEGTSTMLLPTIVLDAPGATLPRELALSAPVPNPLRASTTLRLALPGEQHARLDVFDQQGRRVRTLLDAALPAGEHARTWDGRDDAGRTAPSALYFVRLETGGRTLVRRLAVVR